MCNISTFLRTLQIGIGLCCLVLLEVYKLDFADKSDSILVRSRTMTGHVALGSTLIISFPLVFGCCLGRGSAGLEGVYLSIAGVLNFVAGSFAIQNYYGEVTRDDDSISKEAIAGLAM
ncbi:unnamed protein product, partial [Meganyctiphanes norvegica]